MKVGITFSTFDLFHAGHVKMIEEAKSKCEYLIVGLQLDPSIDRPNKNKPTQSIIERYVQQKTPFQTWNNGTCSKQRFFRIYNWFK